MTRFFLLFLTLPMLAIISACGFSPVYNSSAIGTHSLTISKIEGRSGYLVRQALQARLGGLPIGAYEGGILDISIDENVERLQFQPDGFAARAAITLSGEYVLTKGDKTLTGKVQANNYFNVPDAEYADISAQIDARDTAAQLLAEEIFIDLAAQLQRSHLK